MCDKIEIGLVTEGNFANEVYSGTFPRWQSKYITWTRENPLVTVYLDNIIPDDRSRSKYHIAIMSEPTAIYDVGIRKTQEINYQTADLFFSYYTELNQNPEIFRYYPGGLACYIKPEDRLIYDKTKMISAIFSYKQKTDPQRLRCHIRERAYPNIDFHNPPLEDKIDGIRDYRYQIAIENESTHFSEKLLDCLTTGTIPIYFGHPNIEDHFDINGILKFTTLEEFEEIYNKISVEDYNSRLDAIKTNFELGKKYINVGDVIWEHGLRDFLKEKGEL